MVAVDSFETYQQRVITPPDRPKKIEAAIPSQKLNMYESRADLLKQGKLDEDSLLELQDPHLFYLYRSELNKPRPLSKGKGYPLPFGATMCYQVSPCYAMRRYG